MSEARSALEGGNVSWDDDYDGYWGYPRSKPIPVADGIRAKTQRGPFGKTWWAGRWIAALEAIVNPGRLARGRTYARNGQVISMDVTPQGVAARVQGSDPTPYEASIRFRALLDPEWERVIEVLAGQALYAAKLLNGEMPKEIEEVFTGAGVSLFPATKRDLLTDCTCPDSFNPCKHVAAVHYLLGEQFDDDPFLIFTLRGRTREQIVAALRARRANQAEAEAAPVDAAPAPPASQPLSSDPVAFWRLPETVEALSVPFNAPELAALPIKVRGRPLFWDGALDFEATMEETYRAISLMAGETIYGDR